MKCPNCNGEIKLGEKYCGRCGNPVPDEKSGKDEKKTGKKNAKQNRGSGKKEKSGKNGKKGLFLPLGLGILCVLIIVVVGLVVTPKQTTAGKLQEKMDLGNNYLEKADYVKAKAAFSEALEIDEKSPEAALGMADAYNGQKKPDQALKYLKKASQNVKTASEEKDATHVPKDTADFSSHYEKSCNETADQYKSSNNISKQQETKEVIKDGWFYTGDLAYRDKEGYIFIAGRKKNMIVLKNGKKIFPEEMEELVNQIDLVEESFVFGMPKGDDLLLSVEIKYNEKVAKEKYPNLNEEEIKKLIWNKVKETNKLLPKYKYIKNMILTKEDFIKTSTQKIKRFEEIKKFI